jgi:ABC-2 type transport system ATP-binding protein
MAGQSVLDLSVVPAERDDVEALLSAVGSLPGVERGERVASAGPVFPGGGGPSAFGPAATAGSANAAAPASVSGNGSGPPAASTPVKLRLYLSIDPAAALATVVSLLSGRDAVLTDVHIGTASLEDVFISLTGRGLR